MSADLTPREALLRITGWSGSDVTWNEIGGGLTNRTFLVRSEKCKAVLRLDAEYTTAFNLSRATERLILEEAAAAGLAPQVIWSDIDAGILLSEYVEGKAWQEADLEEDAKLEALAGLLRRVHALPLSGLAFEPVATATDYIARLERRPALHVFALHCLSVIRDIPMSESILCCHNDAVAGNVIGTTTLKLIDWEYACDNDPLFDLAAIIGFHDLEERRQQVLLSAYAGGSRPALKERLADQVRLYDAIQWLWLANRHNVSYDSGPAMRLESLQQRIR